jgi:DNA (cytosine-5)-methyltransferase 1
MKPLIIDLFAGVGGLSLGFRQVGFEIVFANEYEKTIAESYAINHPETELLIADITKISTNDVFSKFNGKVDIVIGVPPCQGF